MFCQNSDQERGKRSRKLHNEWEEEQTKLFGWGGGEKVSVIISILFSPEGGTNRGNHRHRRTSSKAIHSAMWYSNYPTRRSDDCFANWLSLQWGWLTGRLIAHPTYSFGGILGFILPCPHRTIFPIDYFGYLNGFRWFETGELFMTVRPLTSVNPRFVLYIYNHAYTTDDNRNWNRELLASFYVPSLLILWIREQKSIIHMMGM